MNSILRLSTMAGALFALAACDPEKPGRPAPETTTCGVNEQMQGGVCKPLRDNGDLTNYGNERSAAQTACEGASSGGRWTGTACDCSAVVGASLDPVTNSCSTSSTSSGTAETTCRNSGGSWNASLTPSCDCGTKTLGTDGACMEVPAVPENPALVARREACTATASGGTWVTATGTCDCGSKTFNSSSGACEATPAGNTPADPAADPEQPPASQPEAATLRFRAVADTFLISPEASRKNCFIARDKILTVSGDPTTYAQNSEQKVLNVTETDSGCAAGTWHVFPGQFSPVSQ